MGQDIFEKNYNPNDEKFIGKIFNSESALIGLELLRKLCDSGKILYRQPHEFFAMNHVGLMPFASSWTLTLLDTLNQNMKYSVFPLPPVGRNLRYRSFLSGYSVGIFRKKISSEAQLMATWEWLSFLFHQRSQYLMSQLQKLPARKSPLLHFVKN